MPINTQDLKQQNPKDFPNIIFDFGGVIINIDVELTVRAFQDLIPGNSHNIQQRVESSEVFKSMERGLLEELVFLKEFNHLLDSDLEWNTFESAWNVMIGDLPANRLSVLDEVAKSHRIFLLSNTNSIHLRRVNEVVKETTGNDSIDHYFEKAYYSNLIQMRKPDREIYEYVMSQNNLQPDETIFLDDNIHNLKGAEEVGLAVCQITEEKGLMEIFD